MQSTSNQNEQINIENSYRVWLGSLPLPTLMEFLERDVKNNPNTKINLVYDSSIISEEDNIKLIENGWFENGRDVLSVGKINEKYRESRGLKLIDLKEKEFGDDFLKKVIYNKINYQNKKMYYAYVADWISFYVLAHEKNVAWFDTDVDVIRPLNDIANEANSREGNLGMLNNSYLGDYANIQEKDKNTMIGTDATIVFNDIATNCFKISFEALKFYFNSKVRPQPDNVKTDNPASIFMLNLFCQTIEFEKREEKYVVIANGKNDFNINLHAAVLMGVNSYGDITVDNLPEFNRKKREVIKEIKFPKDNILVNKFLTKDHKRDVNVMTIEQKREEKDTGIRNQYKTTTLKVCNYIVEAMEKGKDINKNGIMGPIEKLLFCCDSIDMLARSVFYVGVVINMVEGQIDDRGR